MFLPINTPFEVAPFDPTVTESSPMSAPTPTSIPKFPSTSTPTTLHRCPTSISTPPTSNHPTLH